MSSARASLTLALLAAAALGSLLLSLAAGSAGIEPLRAAHLLLTPGDSLDRAVLLELRLPRTLAAFGCGALLALTGALLQALLQNPLADPFVLGISGGAGALALIAMLLGFAGATLVAGSILGALLSLAILYLLAWKGGLLPTRLLLAGVILSSAWGALVTLVLALAPDAPLRGMVFWLMGDLAATELPYLPLPAALFALLLAWPLARDLDAMARGDTLAASLGVAVPRLRALTLLLAATATALAVICAGSIGFVGLVTPHLLRLAGLRRHRVLLPACVLGGGTLLLAADLAARTAAAPLQLPVGAVTAALGAPVFLWLLSRTSLSR